MKATEKQIVQRRRNWEKGILLGMKSALGQMLHNKDVFTESELKILSGIKIGVDTILNNWVNKRFK
jgi:hypothetical protein